MCLDLNDYQFKTRWYIYRSTYMNCVVITIKTLHCIFENQSKRNTCIILKSIKPQGKTLKEAKKTENYRNNQKTSSKMATSAYLPIISLYVNGLNSPIKRHKVAEWVKRKKDHLCTVCSYNITYHPFIYLKHLVGETYF